jgi:hypothetical protein
VRPRIPRKKAIWAVAEVAVILLLHVILISALAETDLVATILSAGPHAPKLHLLAAGGFALVRVLAVLLLPGIILSRIVLIALDNWVRPRPEQPPTDEEREEESEPRSQDQAPGSV